MEQKASHKSRHGLNIFIAPSVIFTVDTSLPKWPGDFTREKQFDKRTTGSPKSWQTSEIRGAYSEINSINAARCPLLIFACPSNPGAGSYAVLSLRAYPFGVGAFADPVRPW